MRSVKSYFNATLFKKNLTRFWPVWGLYLLIWLFVLPISLFLDDYVTDRFAYRTVLEYIGEVGLPLAVVFSLLAAVAVWSYLFNNRSTCLMHTLPIRREGMFLTNFLSGMTFMVGPNLIVFVLTLLAEAATGIMDVGALVMWFFAVTLMELFFFCFATFCAMCTGHILGMPVFYGVFNVLAVGVTALIDLALDRFVFGYTRVEGLFRAAEWLTPAWKLWDNLEVRVERVNNEIVNSTAWLSGFGYILVYVILGLVLAALALLLYRRRHMERAGDVITVSWMRPVFQYGVAFCCALAFGTLLFEIFRYDLSDTAWALLIFMLICGTAGYFIAKMLLEKSFRVFHCWKGCLPLLAALMLLVCIMEFDVTGYEQRVPDVEDVESVFVYNVSTVPYDEGRYLDMETADPEVIRAVLAVHQAIVEDKDTIEDDPYGGVWGEDTKLGYSVRIKDYAYFNVSYLLESGKVVNRDYTVPVFAEDLNDPNSLTAKLDTLINLPRVIESEYGLSDESADNIIEMSLSSYYIGDGYDGYEDVIISEDACEKVFDAVMADFAEGNIGRRYLMDDEERMNNCFVNDLEIVFYRGKSVEKTDAEGAVYETTVEVPRPTDMSASTEPDIITERITVTLQTTSKHTIAALAEIGVLEKPVNLLTRAQLEMVNNAWAESGESWTNVDLADFTWNIIGE